MSTAQSRLPANVRRIVLPQPPWVGGACYCIEEKGIYVFSEGPGVLWQLTCTHAGNGSLIAYDWRFGSGRERRKLLNLSPAAMGVWHLNAGFTDGLIVENSGGSAGMSSICSVVYGQPKTAHIGNRRSREVTHAGEYVLASSTVKLYEILITKAGAGTIQVFNGLGRKLWHMPSQFIGSFNLANVVADEGLRLVIDTSVALSVTCVWIEDEVGGEDAK